MKMSIFSTNTTSQTFVPFTDGCFVSDCQRQPMLHVNHPHLQFFGIVFVFQIL